MGIFSKNDKRESVQLLLDAYGKCAEDPLTYLSDSFKAFIDYLVPETPGHTLAPQIVERNPPRVAMISGYFVRCAEVVIGQHRAYESDDAVEILLNSDMNSMDRIKSIANYLDDHDKLGLQEKVSNYSLISFETTVTAITDISEDVIRNNLGKKMKKIEKREFRELIYRNIAYGYLFKISEELVGTVYE